MSRARTLADLFNTDGNLNLSPVETINSTSIDGERNLLLNGQFLVWQRGNSITSNNSNKYVCDRWHSGTNGSEDVFYTRQFTNTSDGTPFIRVRRSGTASGRMYLTQMLETSVLDFCRGKTVTLSFQARKHADFDATFVSRIATQTNQTPRDDNVVQNSDVTRTLTTSFQTFTQSLTLTSSSDSANGFRVEFVVEDGANSSNSYYYEVRDVQLEIGTVASDIENRTFEYELARCQRFYFTNNYNNPGASLSGGPCGIAFDAAEAAVPFQFPTIMRAAPSITIYDNAGNSGRVHRMRSGDHANATSASLIGQNGFSNFASSGMTTGAGYLCGVEADAEL